ncbi:probable cationic amino acid transporter [Hyposmocoma kahamanoa]|uniref:probable cationic amino acid transporter n=1 Tax=Hyposmocoma kahamanoa TaxID=1477025 RepID=UPI000E6D92D5|nr:probable cationic amino acid transporter [Hyposmocoma kahamanoa]
MVLEYLIGTSACARALSACFDSLCDGAIVRHLSSAVGTMYGKPPDFLAFGITLLMMLVLVAGVKKSLFFNNVLNAINLSIWVFIMTAGLFYVDITNWTEHKGFLPYGWSGCIFTRWLIALSTSNSPRPENAVVLDGVLWLRTEGSKACYLGNIAGVHTCVDMCAGAALPAAFHQLDRATSTELAHTRGT